MVSQFFVAEVNNLVSREFFLKHSLLEFQNIGLGNIVGIPQPFLAQAINVNVVCFCFDQLKIARVVTTLLLAVSWTQQQLQEEQYPFRHRCIGQYCRKLTCLYLLPPSSRGSCCVL